MASVESNKYGKSLHSFISECVSQCGSKEDLSYTRKREKNICITSGSGEVSKKHSQSIGKVKSLINRPEKYSKTMAWVRAKFYFQYFYLSACSHTGNENSESEKMRCGGNRRRCKYRSGKNSSCQKYCSLLGTKYF